MFLYGEASVTTHRKTVPQIRAGEYEGLTEKVAILIYCYAAQVMANL